jgi:hypothetical protein
MQGLVPHYRQTQMNCDTLDDDAVAMIGPCYLDNGFCDVINRNTAAFLNVFEFGDAGS